MTWSIEFSGFPFLSQLNMTTADHESPSNSDLDCGETCCAMIIQWLTGVSIDADEIKDIILGSENATGPTSAAQLRSFLSTYGSVPTTRLWPQGTTGDGSLTNGIWKYTVAGKPLICLKQFSATTPNYLHWVVVIGLDEANVFYADPWFGSHVAMSYADFAKLYAGVLLGIDRSRDPFLTQ